MIYIYYRGATNYYFYNVMLLTKTDARWHIVHTRPQFKQKNMLINKIIKLCCFVFVQVDINKKFCNQQ